MVQNEERIITQGEDQKKQIVAMLLPSSIAKNVLQDLPKAFSSKKSTKKPSSFPKVSLVFVPSKVRLTSFIDNVSLIRPKCRYLKMKCKL